MNPKVRAKFLCRSVVDRGTGVAVNLEAVTQGSEENKAFWNATPSGQLSMFITNPDATRHFEAGKSYYIDFTPAD